jgi:hypothetical protein
MKVSAAWNGEGGYNGDYIQAVILQIRKQRPANPIYPYLAT